MNIVRKAFMALLENRDFLGYQLDLALGNMSEEVFCNEVANCYLKQTHQPDLEKDPRLLAELEAALEMKLDAELISLIFNCEIEDAFLIRGKGGK